jgi:hypothetical protein
LVSRLKDTYKRWSFQPQEQQELASVIQYLEYIQKGVKIVLTIVDGDFTALGGWGTPDISVAVEKNNNAGKEKTELLAKSGIIDDQDRPQFGLSKEFLWDVSTEITVIAWDNGVFSSTEVFRIQIDTKGLFGYKKLGGRLTDRDRVVNIRSAYEIPDCPWDSD